MLNKKKILSIASVGVALIAITGSVYAATSTTTSTSGATQQTPTAVNQVKEKHNHSNQRLLTLLGMDNATLKQEIKSGKSLADIATSNNIDVQKVIDILVNQETQEIDKDVQAGKLTQAQADQEKGSLAEEIKQKVERKGGFEKEHGHHEGGLKDVASILKTTTTDLQTQLEGGQTIAQIAQAKGINEQDLINQLLQKEKDRLTKMVEKTWQQKDDRETKDDTETNDDASTTTPANNSN